MTVVELVADYADEARALAAKLEVPLAFVAADVLSGSADATLGPGVHAVALHACGALGTRLVEVGAERGVAALSLAPCCLHKGPWRALSAAGRAADPGLDHSALRLATSDEVVAPPRLRRAAPWRRLPARARSAAARGQRARRVHPLRTLPHELAPHAFAAWCRAAAELRGLELPRLRPGARRGRRLGARATGSRLRPRARHLPPRHRALGGARARVVPGREGLRRGARRGLLQALQHARNLLVTAREPG
ncbi:MAG: methyltransferase [Myxococcota bacterium]